MSQKNRHIVYSRVNSSGQAGLEYILLTFLIFTLCTAAIKFTYANIDSQMGGLGARLERMLHTGRLAESTWRN